MDTVGKPATPSAVVPLVTDTEQARGPAGKPVGSGTTGWGVELRTPTQPRSLVVWSDGQWAYEIEGLLVSATDLARDWVQVTP